MISIDDLDLSADLLWVDEFTWQPVVQAQKRTLGGGLRIEETALTGGRPITLQGGAESAWLSRSQVKALQGMASTASATFTLTLNDGTEFTVGFRRPALDVKPVIEYSDPDDDDPYIVNAINLYVV